ncbi:MAG: hypothetical protein JNL67_01635 [Planctomycetaceae bacterium]|nr:hypothetical protein [Planctomycetaceae bacterium]
MTNLPVQNDESPQLLRDLLMLASVPHDTIVAIANDLGRAPQFVALEKLIGQHIDDAALMAAVAKLVSNINMGSVPTITQMVQTWRESFASDKKPLSEEGFDLLKKNLEALATPAIEEVIRKTRKATALLTATGNEVTGLTFICDARPVYNEERTDIEGYVPLATMKVYFDRPNEQQDVIEFTMTPVEVDAIIDRAMKAREKLNVMQNKFSGWLPNGTGEDVQ